MKYAELEDNKNLVLDCIFYVFSALFFGVVIYDCFSVTRLLVDTYEHVHASWLVSEGKVPYLDFFEHHNPLLWFLFAPITKLMERNIDIVYVARVITVFTYLCSFFLTYKIIAKHLANATVAKLSMLFCYLIPLGIYLVDFRPDPFMILCDLSGLYFLFNYLDNQKNKNLCLSYFLIALGFLFIQKNLFFIGGLGLSNIYLLCKRKIKIKDFISACLCGLVPICLFAIYLFATSSYLQWFHNNVTFNSLLKKYYDLSFYSNIQLLCIFVALSLFIVPFVLEKNIKNTVLEFLIFFEGAFCLIFAFHPYYFFTYILLVSVAFGKLFYKYIFNKNLLINILYLSSFICIISNLSSALEYPGIVRNYTNYTKVANSIYKKTDIVYSPNIFYGNLFNHDVSYYWFANMYIPIIESLFGDKEYSMDSIISSQKADYIYYNSNGSIVDNSCKLQTEWFKKRNIWLLDKSRKSNNLQFYIDKVYIPDCSFYHIDMGNLKKYYDLIQQDEKHSIWKKKQSD